MRSERRAEIVASPSTPRTDQALARKRASLELALHRGLGRWARQHAERYPSVGVLPYAPSRYPDQAIDVALSHTRRPTNHQLEALRQFYLGASAGTASSLAAFTTSRPGEIDTGTAIRNLVEAGRRVAVLSAHAERLDDVGELLGAVAVAAGTPDFFPLNSVILNKVMSRETFRGTPVVDLLQPYANIYWAIPDSGNARRWHIPDEAVRYVNLRMVRALLRGLRTGAAVTFAPAGSAMITHRNRSGDPETLEFPLIGSATKKLLRRFDNYVLAVRWQDTVLVEGPYFLDPELLIDDATSQVMEGLRTLVTSASGLPVLPLEGTGTDGAQAGA